MSDVAALLVEDNPGDATLVRRYLDTPLAESLFDSISLDHVETLEDAAPRLQTTGYDVVLLDLGLAASTGLETLERARDLVDSVPIIVLTGLEDTEAATQAIGAGAQDFLSKNSLDGDRLVRAIRYSIERYEQEQRLQRQNERLDFFNSILRHDMLNGLNIVMAQADLLTNELEDPAHLQRAETIREWSEDITELGKKVRSVLETVTDEDGARLGPVSLTKAVDTQVQRARSTTDRVAFDVDVPDACVVVANDLLEDVVGNLLMNAVEHTDGERTVTVTVREEGGQACLRIADDGAGIEAENLSSVFERGNKGSSSSGTGFGLFFVSSMVESYGGTVEVTESESGGAAFEVSLPVAERPTA